MRLRALGILALAVLAGCSKEQAAPPAGGASAAATKPIKIGFSMDTLKEERWQRDRDLVVERAKQLGAEVLVQSANGDDALQNAQAENLLTQGVDVLLVAPHNAKTTATIVESAHRSNVPVIAYDRLIEDSDLDMYVSFDAVKIGELQASDIVKRMPKGRYLWIGGAPTDNNAHLLRKGNFNVLQPLVDKGDITLVAEQWAKDWQPIEALKITENALTRTGNKIDAIIAPNDGTAGGVIQALEEQKLGGKVLVSGQDGDLAAAQRIMAGSQTMTIYKPIKSLAYKAAETAILMARKQPVPDATQKINNGRKDVPSILLGTIAVDKANMASTIVADGWQKKEAVYKDVPKDQWPSP
jgi:D-xylose transport system substrate-binding protein